MTVIQKFANVEPDKALISSYGVDFLLVIA